MQTIIVSVISISTLGVICAALLSIATKLMSVAVDERILGIQELLPGSNCGACGFPGCLGYARALVEDENVKTTLCPPGGAKLIKQLGDVLGVEDGDGADGAVKFAVIHCMGDSTVSQKKMAYTGIQTCMAAKQLFGGESACTYGCLGYGDCQIPCPSDAIYIENELARIHTKLCTGCGLCIKACPNELITMEHDSIATVVVCKNLEKGAVVRKKCSKCCLGCGKCARECPSAAIILEDHLAKIDYEKCIGCRHCADICVTQCIQPICPNTNFCPTAS